MRVCAQYVVNKDKIFYDKMKKIGAKLHLKEHIVHGIPIIGPVDIEAHAVYNETTKQIDYYLPMYTKVKLYWRLEEQ